MSRLREVFIAQRERSGMTYDELAAESGLSRRTLLHIATGKYVGDLKTWLILSKVWDADLNQLLGPVWE